MGHGIGFDDPLTQNVPGGQIPPMPVLFLEFGLETSTPFSQKNPSLHSPVGNFEPSQNGTVVSAL